MAAATSPIRLDELGGQLIAQFPVASPEQIHALLRELVDARILITSLRPPMTSVAPLTHLIEALRAAGAEQLPDVAALPRRLEEVSEQLTRHKASTDPQQAGALRASAAAQMAALVPGAEYVLATDVRLDAQIALPERVLREAELAASVLLRLSTKPFGSAAWRD